MRLARLGMLLFFAGAGLAVWLWTRRDFGVGAGLAAAFFVTTNPPVLAHAGLGFFPVALIFKTPLPFIAFAALGLVETIRYAWARKKWLALKVGPRGYRWLEAYEPVATVGHSIRLYHIPPSGR